MKFCCIISAEDLQCASAASLPRNDYLVALAVSRFLVIKQYVLNAQLKSRFTLPLSLVAIVQKT